MNEAKRPNLIGEWRYMYGRIITMGLTPAHWSFWECVFYHMNDSRWQPWVTITTDTLLQRTQVSSRKVLYRLRRELEAAGLLAYRRGNRGCPGEYRVIMQEFSNRWFNTEVTENTPPTAIRYTPPAPQPSPRAPRRAPKSRPAPEPPKYEVQSGSREYRGLSHWREDNKELLERTMKNRGRRVIKFESLQPSDQCDKMETT